MESDDPIPSTSKSLGAVPKKRVLTKDQKERKNATEKQRKSKQKAEDPEGFKAKDQESSSKYRSRKIDENEELFHAKRNESLRKYRKTAGTSVNSKDGLKSFDISNGRFVI